jgi:hypothetical protein
MAGDNAAAKKVSVSEFRTRNFHMSVEQALKYAGNRKFHMGCSLSDSAFMAAAREKRGEAQPRAVA